MGGADPPASASVYFHPLRQGPEAKDEEIVETVARAALKRRGRAGLTRARIDCRALKEESKRMLSPAAEMSK